MHSNAICASAPLPISLFFFFFYFLPPPPDFATSYCIRIITTSLSVRAVLLARKVSGTHSLTSPLVKSIDRDLDSFRISKESSQLGGKFATWSRFAFTRFCICVCICFRCFDALSTPTSSGPMRVSLPPPPLSLSRPILYIQTNLPSGRVLLSMPCANVVVHRHSPMFEKRRRV